MGAPGHCRHGMEHQGHGGCPEGRHGVRCAPARSPCCGQLRGLMTEIGFYHLTRSTLIEALPQLLTRTLATGQRALVLGPESGLDALSTALWAQPAWLP